MTNAPVTGSLLRRFALSGIVNTVAGLATVFTASGLLGLSDYLANGLGYAVGIGIGFMLHRHYAFRDRQRVHLTVPRYALAFLASYGVNLLVLLASLEQLHWPPLPAQLAAICTYSACFFLLCRWFVFRPTAGRCDTG